MLWLNVGNVNIPLAPAWCKPYLNNGQHPAGTDFQPTLVAKSIYGNMLNPGQYLKPAP